MIWTKCSSQPEFEPKIESKFVDLEVSDIHNQWKARGVWVFVLLAFGPPTEFKVLCVWMERVQTTSTLKELKFFDSQLSSFVSQLDFPTAWSSNCPLWLCGPWSSRPPPLTTRPPPQKQWHPVGLWFPSNYRHCTFRLSDIQSDISFENNSSM